MGPSKKAVSERKEMLTNLFLAGGENALRDMAKADAARIFNSKSFNPEFEFEKTEAELAAKYYNNMLRDMQ